MSDTMARTFSGLDVTAWKVCDRMGKPFRYSSAHPNADKRSKPMTDLKGFADANALAERLGGVAVRV